MFEMKAVRECRGLILDIDNNWTPVAFPFESFFSFDKTYFGQKKNMLSTINWKSAKVKLYVHIPLP